MMETVIVMQKSHHGNHQLALCGDMGKVQVEGMNEKTIKSGCGGKA
jgi:translation elongation factor EF-1alpha